jgi:hypothetical protein
MVKEYKVKDIKEPELTPDVIEDENVVPQTAPAPTTKKGFSVPTIPTEKIFKVVSDRQMMGQMWKDETMEPHVHMIKLLVIVVILAVVISVLGSMLGL